MVAACSNEAEGRGKAGGEEANLCIVTPRTIIDILLLGYVLYQFVDSSHDAVHGIGWSFALLGVLNAIFLHVWRAQHYIVSFIFALLVAAVVSGSYYRLAAHFPAKGLLDALFVHLPFSLWHAWSIVTVFISGFAAFTQ
jgi:hypothetical protein